MFDDPNYLRHDYDPVTAYGQSKTANVLFALALDEKGRSEGVRAFSLHPGTIVETRFRRDMPEGCWRAVGMVDADGTAVLDTSKGWKSVERGRQLSVWCAASPDLEGKGGLYAQDCDIAPLLDHTDPGVMAAANSSGPAALGVMDYALDGRRGAPGHLARNSSSLRPEEASNLDEQVAVRLKERRLTIVEHSVVTISRYGVARCAHHLRDASGHWESRLLTRLSDTSRSASWEASPNVKRRSRRYSVQPLTSTEPHPVHVGVCEQGVLGSE